MMNKAAGIVRANAHNVHRSAKMKMVARTVLVAAVAGGVALAVALPAAAATSGTTSASFTLTGSTLSVSVPASATLSTASAGGSKLSVYGALGTTTVTDARGGTTGWTLYAGATAFTGPDSATTTSISDVWYSVGPSGIAITGTVTATPNQWTATIGPNGYSPCGSGSVPVVTATGVSGNNTAAFNPGLIVYVPTTATGGKYAGTVTVSVA